MLVLYPGSSFIKHLDDLLTPSQPFCLFCSQVLSSGPLLVSTKAPGGCTMDLPSETELGGVVSRFLQRSGLGVSGEPSPQGTSSNGLGMASSHSYRVEKAEPTGSIWFCMVSRRAHYGNAVQNLRRGAVGKTLARTPVLSGQTLPLPLSS